MEDGNQNETIFRIHYHRTYVVLWTSISAFRANKVFQAYEEKLKKH